MHWHSCCQVTAYYPWHIHHTHITPAELCMCTFTIHTSKCMHAHAHIHMHPPPQTTPPYTHTHMHPPPPPPPSHTYINRITERAPPTFPSSTPTPHPPPLHNTHITSITHKQISPSPVPESWGNHPERNPGSDMEWIWDGPGGTGWRAGPQCGRCSALCSHWSHPGTPGPPVPGHHPPHPGPQNLHAGLSFAAQQRAQRLKFAKDLCPSRSQQQYLVWAHLCWYVMWALWGFWVRLLSCVYSGTTL